MVTINMDLPKVAIFQRAHGAEDRQQGKIEVVSLNIPVRKQDARQSDSPKKAPASAKVANCRGN